MKNPLILSLFILILFIFGCTSSQEISTDNDQKQPDVYVFDDVEKIDTTLTDTVSVAKSLPNQIDSIKTQEVNTPLEHSKSEVFIVQIGAFSSYERAQSFMKENQPKTSYKFFTNYNDQTKLFVVRTDEYSTREEAEKVRNFLWQFTSMKGAFIVTLEK